jgi:bifunctional DNA-binding transcriptional regulator/antitoxin component of YhaV-PrlF toxin-antitoxin module
MRRKYFNRRSKDGEAGKVHVLWDGRVYFPAKTVEDLGLAEAERVEVFFDTRKRKVIIKPTLNGEIGTLSVFPSSRNTRAKMISGKGFLTEFGLDAARGSEFTIERDDDEIVLDTSRV